jgi:hypothetical protein
MIIAAIIAVAAVGLLPALIGLIAVPLGLGQAHWLWRLAYLYGLTIFFGISMSVLALGTEKAMLVILALLLIAAAVCSDPAESLRFASLVAGAILWWIVVCVVALLSSGGNAIDTQWVARGAVCVLIVAFAAWLMRLVGYRLVQVYPSTQVTGFNGALERDFDEWYQMLERFGGRRKSSEAIHQHLRVAGLDHQSATQVLSAYARVTGLIPISKTFDGRREFANLDNHDGWTTHALENIYGLRFSISQLFVWTTAAASLFGLLKVSASRFPVSEDVTFGPPLLFILSVVSVATAVAAFALPPRKKVFQRYFVVMVIIAALPPNLFTALGFGAMPSMLIFLLVLSTSGWLLMGFQVMRHSGYRLVRVAQRQRTLAVTANEPLLAPSPPAIGCRT